jgi:hypothetical protein
MLSGKNDCIDKQNTVTTHGPRITIQKSWCISQQRKENVKDAATVIAMLQYTAPSKLAAIT